MSRAVGPLLERDREVARLRELVGAAADGRGGAVAIEGPAGIGKSRLLGRLADEAGDAGVRVLAARAGELEAGLPHAVVRRLFEPHLASLDGAARRRALAGAAQLARPAVWSVDPAAAGDEAALTHGLYWLVVNLTGDGPLASWWTTPTGSTEPRWGCSRTWSAARPSCRCWWSTRRGPSRASPRSSPRAPTPRRSTRSCGPGP